MDSDGAAVRLIFVVMLRPDERVPPSDKILSLVLLETARRAQRHVVGVPQNGGEEPAGTDIVRIASGAGARAGALR